MICVLSPAKTMVRAADISVPFAAKSVPQFLTQSSHLASVLKSKTRAELRSLCDVSANLAEHVHQLYKDMVVFDHKDSATITVENLSDSTRFNQAALMFDGPAFKGFAAEDLTETQALSTQNHLRILCGLYGAVRPGDLIQEYRLCMGTKLAANKSHADLYSFWGSSIADSIMNDFSIQFDAMKNGRGASVSGTGQKGSKTSAAAGTKSTKGTSAATESIELEPLLVNVASQEYFRSIKQYIPDSVHVIECVFLDQGMIKSAFAKRARGLMARFACTSDINSYADREKLKDFCCEGYKYSCIKSDECTYVFDRAKPVPIPKKTAAAGKKKTVVAAALPLATACATADIGIAEAKGTKRTRAAAAFIKEEEALETGSKNSKNQQPAAVVAKKQKQERKK